jgi:hypothetical protein
MLLAIAVSTGPAFRLDVAVGGSWTCERRLITMCVTQMSGRLAVEMQSSSCSSGDLACDIISVPPLW